jgi:hypothetical protein
LYSRREPFFLCAMSICPSLSIIPAVTTTMYSLRFFMVNEGFP